MTTKAKIDLKDIIKNQNEVVKDLNHLLADFQIFTQKVRKYHWNVEGPSFFELHEKLDEMYERLSDDIDKVAERVRKLDDYPVATMSEYLEITGIEEGKDTQNAQEMISDIVADTNHFIEELTNAIKSAEKYNDIGTSDMYTQMLRSIEEDRWMLKAFLAKS